MKSAKKNRMGYNVFILETRERRQHLKNSTSALRAWHARVTALAVCAVIVAVTLLSVFLPDREFSDEENRSLAGLPVLSAASLKDGTYFSGMSSYLQDQIAGRDSWMRARAQLDRLAGHRSSGGVYYGRNGYLLEEPAAPDAAAVERTAQMMRAFSEAYPKLHMMCTLVPCNAAVHPDLLPHGSPVRDQIADIDAVRSMLSESDIAFISVTNALRSETEGLTYYKTDHHWTSRGALLAFRAMQYELGIDYTPYYNGVIVTEDFEGTLSSKTGDHRSRDTIEVFYQDELETDYVTYYSDTKERSPSIFVSSMLETKDKYQVFFGGNHPLVEIRTTVDNGKCLLIFKDSYANCFVQFLLPYYDRIVLVDPRYYYDDIGALIKTEGITDVLFLYSMNMFATDKSLADVLASVAGAGDDGAEEDQDKKSADKDTPEETERSEERASGGSEDTAADTSEETDGSEEQMTGDTEDTAADTSEETEGSGEQMTGDTEDTAADTPGETDTDETAYEDAASEEES